MKVLGEGGRKGVSGDTKKLSRKHIVEVSDSGLVSLMGGKWTSYRKMGEDAVDTVIKNFEWSNLTHKESVTSTFGLIGSYTRLEQDK